MKPHLIFHRLMWALSLLAALMASPEAQAQLRLPNLPQLPGAGPGALRGATDPLRAQAQALLEPLSLRELGDQMLDRYPRQLTRNAAGELVLRAQLLALPSSPEAQARVLALPGVTLLEDTPLESLNLHWLLLRADTKLLAQLRTLDPAGQYDYQHVYLGGGTTLVRETSADEAQRLSPSTKHADLRLGMIDSGVALRHPALRQAQVQAWGCDGETHPAAHGTAVASLLVGQDGRFQGAVPGARLLAADAYCDAPDGGSAQRVAKSLDWLAREHAGVVNMSLVGPANVLLQRAVAAAQAKGLLIVAAVGNDGPAAPPLYPAAWPGVVAVTGVDTRRRVLPEAGRGPHVQFAAPGSELWGADPTGAYGALRGTSFAAPLVAGLLAETWPAGEAPSQAVERLRAIAIDLGPAGRDEIYGWGLVGEGLRTRSP